MVKKWRRSAAAILAAALLAWSFPVTAAAKDGYYDRALDDNQQQIFLLGAQSPQSYCSLLTINAAHRQELWNLAHRLAVGCSTDSERAGAVYDWVTQNIYYDWDGIWEDNLPMEDPYSVYSSRRAVCEGYSTLYAELLNCLGIPCVTFHGSSNGDSLSVTSDENSSWDWIEYNDVDHAWNAAFINGKWRYYDTTWGSGNTIENGVWRKGEASRDYFAIDPDAIASNHRTAYRINTEGGYRMRNQKWVMCDADGKPWNGVWYDFYTTSLYYMEEGTVVTGRAIVEYQLVEFDDAGKYLDTRYDYTGWEKFRGDWYYIRGGITCYGWGFVNGKWYYMDPDTSVMQTGWKRLNGKWYFLGGDGAMRTGWAFHNGQWYWMDSSGVMTTGWRKVGNQWYYLKGSGAMATGWLRLGENWYYLGASGAMATGWQDINGKTYYFDENGVMAIGRWVISGRTYDFGMDGALA